MDLGIGLTGALITIGVIGLPALIAILFVLNFISYSVMKNRILERRKWGLNICCGKTDGGGVNADIMKHAEVPNYVELDCIYSTPFTDNQFETVLCSHTMEHVDDPEAFFAELERVGKRVTLVLPPVWDVSAALNVLEHKWIFLTFKKEHSTLPPRVRLPFADLVQEKFGQRIHA
jgi:hypothetical protein